MGMSKERCQKSVCRAALLVMIVLLVLTPVFKYMPQNAQGAIVISAVVSLFNYTEWWFLWKVSLCMEHYHPLLHELHTQQGPAHEEMLMHDISRVLIHVAEQAPAAKIRSSIASECN